MKKFQPLPLAVLVLASYCLHVAEAQFDLGAEAQFDLGDTLVPEAKGRAVVQNVVDVIAEAKLFSRPDFDLIFRAAWVASRFGKDPETFAPGNVGGIWQIDATLFARTKNTRRFRGLATRYPLIEAAFGIDWPSVTLEDLSKPLYSGLAARLVSCTAGERIPEALVDQSLFWFTHYNNGRDSVKKFYDSVVVMGDPHVVQDISGADQALCYNIFGENKATYNILTEADMDIEIFAQIAESSGKKAGKYVGSVDVIFGGRSITVNTDEIAVSNGKQKLTWDSTFNNVVAKDGVRLTIDNSGVQIDYMSLVIIDVKKIFKSDNVFLNLDVSHVGRFSEASTGILGDVYRSTSVVKKEGATSTLNVQQPDGSVLSEPVFHTSKCWKLVSHKEASKSLQSIVDNNKLSD